MRGAIVKRTAVNVVRIRAGDREYDGLVGEGLLGTLGAKVANLLRGPRCVVIADENTARLFGDTVMRSLSEARFAPSLLTVPAGEGSKSLEQIGRLCGDMATGSLDRSSFVVALGGGVVGDLAGFAAAIYHRGIPYVQVPTTLLAQVDSSIGGKTGVNTSAGKNLLGAVHQPALVIADVETLAQLPRREVNQGFAEIIKHAIIADASLFGALEEVAQLSELRAPVDASWKLAPLICRNIELKAAIVAKDDRDTSGERALLNFGHTVGHGIERAGNYRQFLHGEALSLGIVAACEVSTRKAGLPESDKQKVVRILERFNLPTELPADFPRAEILLGIRADKKFERGEVRFVVSPALGSARLSTDITLHDIAQAIERL